MGGHSKILKVLPKGYGFVVLTATGSVFLNFWLMRNVMVARKKFGIEYPTLYSPDNKEFNCIQRAHQNTLELYPQFLALLLLGGLQLPKLTAGAGVLYLIGRIFYAKGYYTGEPENRKYGFIGSIGMLLMLGNTICFAVHQLKWTPWKTCEKATKSIKLAK